MTFFMILNAVSILIMMFISTWLAGKLAQLKRDMGYSYIKSAFQILVYFKFGYAKLVFRNPLYVWLALLQLAIIATALTQIGLFMTQSIFTKPIFVFMVAPFLWVSIYAVLRVYDRKLRRANLE